MKNGLSTKLIYIFVCFMFVLPASAKNLKILVSINPIYSLVKNITRDLDDTKLLIDANTSPHNYQLKPSDIKKIQEADLIFIIDDDFEVFLANYLAKTKIKAKVIKLIEFPNLVTLPARNIKVLDVAGSKEHHEDEDPHDHHDDHHYLHNIDLHVWTDPLNAQVLVHEVAVILGEYDPKHKTEYLKNSRETIEKLHHLDKDLSGILDKKIQQQSFIVFHDAYQYMERRYHLRNAGAVAGNNFVYGPRTMQKLHDSIEKYHIKCIFAEPQFSGYFMQKVAKNTGTKLGYLDIEGGSFGEKVDTEDLYFFMMKRNVENIRACLSS